MSTIQITARFLRAARYNRNFVVTKADIEALIPKIEQLKQIVEKVCRERIAYYDSQIKKQA